METINNAAGNSETLNAAETLNTLTTLGDTFAVRSLEEASKLDLSADQYLVRKIERGTGLESKGVVIPAVTAEQFLVALDSDTVLQGAISWYQAQVAEVVKQRMTAGRATIALSDFSLEEVAKYIGEQEVREGRISKEKIATWFDSALVESLNAAFSEKLGTQYTEQVKAGVIESYKKQFARLTQKDLVLEPEVKGSLLKACSLAPAESAVRQYCEAKIREAKQPSAMLSLL